jgi:hypothetical protein
MALKYRGKNGPLALETESWADRGKRIKKITARDAKKRRIAIVYILWKGIKSPRNSQKSVTFGSP